MRNTLTVVPKHRFGFAIRRLRLCHRAKAVTYVVRRTCVHRSVYVRTAFGVHAYGVRRTSPSGWKAMMKQV